MNKYIKILLVLFLLLPSFLSPISMSTAYAENGEETKQKCEKPTYEEEDVQKKFDEFREEYANLIEKFMLDAIEVVMNLFGLNTLNQLVFGNPYCTWFQGGTINKLINGVDLTFGVFPTKVYDTVVKPLFNMFTSSAVLLYTLAILIIGLKLMVNASFRLGEELLYFMLVAALLVGYWVGVEYFLQFNQALVSDIKGVLDKQGINPSGALNIVAEKDSFTFMDIILLLANWIMILFLNVVYVFRLFLIAVYMIFGGFAIVCLLFPSTRKIFMRWLVDFAGIVLMQSFHALYFAAILIMIDVDKVSEIFELFLLILFLPISSMAMALFSFSAASTAVMAGQRMTSGVNMAVNQASNSGNQIAKLANSSTGKLGKAASIGSSKISALAKGDNTFGTFKTIAGLTGRVAGTMAGSVVGGGGMALGGNLGQMAGNQGLQTARNVVAGAKGLMDTRGNVKSGYLDLNNMQDKRTLYGNMGESFGTMLGMGNAGRQIGEKMSGVSDELIRSSTGDGGLAGITLQEIAATYPDATLQFRQTNEGSGFYMNNGEEDKLVSPLGAADPNLKDGETRVQDYSLSGNTEGLNSSLYEPNSQAAIMGNDGTRHTDTAFNSSAYSPEHFISSELNRSAMHDLSNGKA
ncbi:hypothetical protein [Solibacillus isronensis]|uniref:hypothetical protein n=1 Tax=Solibacillus isronensis TaxID=412383 RepID=UPI0009A697FF|nr:hypothetical protein [Solibacillus isronensis]